MTEFFHTLKYTGVLNIRSLDETEDVPILSIENRVSIKSICGEFNPNRLYALGTEMHSLKDKEAIQFLHDTAKKFLPEGTKYEIRASDNNTGFKDFGRVIYDGETVAAWLYSPKGNNSNVPKNEVIISDGQWRQSFSYGCFKIGPFFA